MQAAYYVSWKFCLVLSHVKHKLHVRRVVFAQLRDATEYWFAQDSVGRGLS